MEAGDARPAAAASCARSTATRPRTEAAAGRQAAPEAEDAGVPRGRRARPRYARAIELEVGCGRWPASPSTCAPTPSPARPRPCARPWPRPRSATTSTARTRPSPRSRSGSPTLLGKEAALFVPLGDHGQPDRAGVHTRPGDEVLAGEGAHCWLLRVGRGRRARRRADSMLAGDGRFTADEVRAGVQARQPTTRRRPALSRGEHPQPRRRARLAAGGARPGAVAAARELGLAPPRRRAPVERGGGLGALRARARRRLRHGVVCLSKGLGAPVGSLVAATARA